MVMKPTNVHKCMLCYKHSTPATCFGHSCGHPQGCITKDGNIERLQKFVNQCTDVKYEVLNHTGFHLWLTLYNSTLGCFSRHIFLSKWRHWFCVVTLSYSYKHK
jgi:hypothetical protein